MFYGAVVISDTDEHKTIKLYKAKDANILFNKGCEAVFICEPDAYRYAYEQSEIRRIAFDVEIYDLK